MATASEDTLKQLIADIGLCLDAMSGRELETLASQWPALIRYLNEPLATNEGFAQVLDRLIQQSPTLIENAFSDVLNDMLRYTPTSSEKSPPQITTGLAPIRNEVIRMGKEIDDKLRANQSK